MVLLSRVLLLATLDTTMITNADATKTSEQTTINASTTTSPCKECENVPSSNGCSQTDWRGNDWNADFGKNATKPCNVSNFGAAGTSWWFCDLALKRFSTPQPDTSDCTSSWVEDVEDMLNSSNKTATEVC